MGKIEMEWGRVFRPGEARLAALFTNQGDLPRFHLQIAAEDDAQQEAPGDEVSPVALAVEHSGSLPFLLRERPQARVIILPGAEKPGAPDVDFVTQLLKMGRRRPGQLNFGIWKLHLRNRFYRRTIAAQAAARNRKSQGFRCLGLAPARQTGVDSAAGFEAA
jgi:hypothetical protein